MKRERGKSDVNFRKSVKSFEIQKVSNKQILLKIEFVFIVCFKYI